MRQSRGPCIIRQTCIEAPDMRCLVLALLLVLPVLAPTSIRAQRATTPPAPADTFARAPRRGYVPKSSHADSLRGALDSPGRRWWDVTFYDLHVAVNPRDSSIAGHNAITYRVLGQAAEMQIDLMQPLQVDSMLDQDRRAVRYRRDGDVYFATLPSAQRVGQLRTVTVYYHGRPRIARNPPWEGGFTWTQDSLGRPWVVTTDQGMGASAWWPNKDVQADEPDSQRVALTLPDPMIDVSNGRLRGTTKHPDGTTTYEWFVVNPINNYAIAVAAGSYAHWSEMFDGLNGQLTLDFWPLDYNLGRARTQFTQARTMLKCFEHWFGPYPWYEDGYKLLEVPNAGMEHQSAVAYGNWYENGYRRRESSGTGIGYQWDFIIVHESAHEWWGNSITAKDNADMWVHESFANYAEGIYTECLLGKDAASRYIVGNRRGIRNDRPIIPAYGVNDQGSGDMYPKGGEMLHTIRQIVDDDEKWRGILTGLQRTFRHQTVMGRQIEEYISTQAGTNLGKVFDQYLRTTMVPTFEYTITGDTLAYRWATVVPGFDMQLAVTLADSTYSVIHPTERWQRTRLRLANPSSFAVKPDYYVIPKAVAASGST
jgi:aminopeptidase N